MADNVELNSGSGGATAASDDIGGIQYQRVKFSVGADGTAVDAVPVSAGLDTTATGVQAVGIVAQLDDASTAAVTENQFAPVRLSSRRALLVEGVASGTAQPISAASLPLPTDAATETTVSALAGDVGDTADAAATAGGTGTLHAKQRLMTSQLDSIKTAVEVIDNAISGSEMQVDVVAALPAGTNNIGDVDVLSIVPGTGATNLGKAIDTATGATDTGVLALATRDDALGALTPIEGDNVALRTDANGALWTHDDALDAALSGSELQVDVVAALPAGTNNIGDIDVLSIAAGDNNIGNVDIASIVSGTGATNLGKAEDGAHTSGDVGVMALAVRNDTPNAALAGTDLDYVPIAAYRTGAIRVAPPNEDFAALGGQQVKKYYTNAGAVTDGIVWSPAAGARWYVTDIFINVSAAATITLEDDLAAGDSAVWKAELAANSGWSHSYSTPLFSGEDAADLLITTSAGNVYVSITGYEI